MDGNRINEQVYLSVVIPAYNESGRIGPSLERIIRYLKMQAFLYEVIVVDDGSSDGTGEAVARTVVQEGVAIAVIKNDGNKGKGFCVREGALASRGEYVLFSDADLSTPIEEVEKFWPFFDQGYDVIIGSRALDKALLKERQPWYRERMGKMFNFLVQTIVMKGIRDTQCGFKCFRRSAVEKIFPRAVIKRFAFDVELLYIAAKHELRIKDVPVLWHNSPQSRVRVIQDSLKMIIDLIRISHNGAYGKYD